MGLFDELPEMNYTGAFTGIAVRDGLLDTESCSEDIHPSFKAEGHFMEVTPTKSTSASHAARYVEDTFLGLLREGRKVDIAVLSGEAPAVYSDLDGSTVSEFQSQYRAALKFNPGLKYYAKLARTLKSEQFSCDGDGLTLSVSRDAFKKTFARSLNDFPASLGRSSEIVSCVRRLASIDSANGVLESRERFNDTRIRKGSNEADLNITSSDFSDSAFDASLEDTGCSEGFDRPETHKSLNISMLDLSNKVLAEILDAKKLSIAAISTQLLDEGFPTQRVNEIAGIVRFARRFRENLRTGR